MNALSLGALSLLATALVAMGFAWVLAWAFPRMVRRASNRTPAARIHIITMLLTAPLLTGALVTATCFLASGLAQRAAHLDHCLAHQDGHPHLCLTHGHWFPNALGWALLGAGLAALLLLVHRTWARHQRARGSLQALAMLGASELPEYTLLHLDQPLAFTTGLWKARVWVSQGLVVRLGDSGMRAVLAHEAAHARHRDPLRMVFAEVAASLLPPSVRRSLLDDLELALEHRADEGAVAATGSRLKVAETLLQAQRLLGLRPLAATFFQGSRLEARVTVLLEPMDPSPALRLWPWALALGAMALALSDPLHHGVETLLGLLSR